MKKKPPLPTSITPLISFPTFLWIFIAIFCVSVAFLYRKIRFLSNNLNNFKSDVSYFKILIDTVLYVFNSPVLRHCMVCLDSERVYIFTLSVMGLILSTLFQSYLNTNMVTQASWEKDINTLDQLAQSNLPIEIRYVAIMEDLFPENTSRTFDLLRQHMVLVKYDQFALNRLYEHGSFSLPLRRSLVHLDFSEWFFSGKLYLVPQCPKNYLLAYPIMKNSIFLERFNVVLLRLLEGGMIRQWTNEIYRNHTIMETLSHKAHLINEVTILTMPDLQFPFYTLIFGINLSTLIVIFEIFGLKVNRFLSNIESKRIYKLIRHRMLKL